MIRYSMEDRANAARLKKDLFVCGYAEAMGKGRSEFMGPMHWRMADALFAFCHRVHCGKSPAEAFAEINWSAAESSGESTDHA